VRGASFLSLTIHRLPRAVIARRLPFGDHARPDTSLLIEHTAFSVRAAPCT